MFACVLRCVGRIPGHESGGSQLPGATSFFSRERHLGLTVVGPEPETCHDDTPHEAFFADSMLITRIV